MTMDQNVGRLEELLSALAGGATTTDAIKSATSVLTSEYRNKPSSIPLFVKIISSSSHWQVRQLAALELDKEVVRHWEDLAGELQEEIRKALPGMLANEPHKLVRLSISEAIGAIARLDFPEKKWVDLLDFVFHTATSQNVAHRECAVRLIHVLFDTIADNFADRLSQAFGILQSALVDPESQVVRNESVEGLTRFSEYIESEQKDQVAAFQGLIPSIVNVLQESIKQEDVEASNKALELFESALLSEAPLLKPCFKELLNFMMGMATDRTVNEEIRVGVVSFLCWAAQYKKTQVIKEGLVDPLLRVAMQVAVEPEHEDLDEECPARSSITLIGVMASNLPAQQIFSILGPLIIEYIGNTDAGFRKAALLALAVAAEGCSEFLSAKVSEILPLIQSSLPDPSPIVRRAACFALYSLTDELGEEVTKYHEIFLPQLFSLLTDPDEEVAKNVWNAIDSFMTEIGTTAEFYLPALMDKSDYYLTQLPTNLKFVAIAAIGSAASSAGKAFIPYFPNFMNRLREFMTIKSDDDSVMTLRAISTDAASNVALAVGKEVIAPYVQDLMTLAFEGMDLKGSHLRDSGFAMFGTMATVLGPDFVGYLSPVMEQVKKTLDADEFADVRGEESSVDLNNVPEDEDEEEENVNLSTSISQEKESAISCTVEIFREVGKPFLPYLESTLQIYVGLLDHYSDGVRQTTFEALLSFIMTLNREYKPAQWQSGLPLKAPIDQGVLSAIDMVMPVLMEKWKEEGESVVVNTLLIQLDLAIQEVGPALVQNFVEPITNELNQIFRKEALCQVMDNDDEDRLDMEDLAEQDSALIINAADVLGSMCKALGAEYLPLFRPFFNLLKKHFKPNLPETERSMTVAVFGDVLLGLGSCMTEYTNELVTIFGTGLTDPSPIVRSNSAFGIGILCLTTQADISSQYPTLINHLGNLMHNQPHNTTDNACGALCRMIKAQPQACPISEIIPSIIQHLPLKEDLLENEPIYECLLELIAQGHPVIAGEVMEKLKGLFATMVNETPDHLPQNLCDRVRSLLG